MKNNIALQQSFQQKLQPSFLVQLNRNSTLCVNKEFFYLINLINEYKIKKEREKEIENKITEKEYIEANQIIINLESIDFKEMSKYEKELYKQSLNTIKKYLSYTK